MRNRLFGANHLQVSELGFGTAQLANTDNKYHGTPYVPLEEAREILALLIDGGINFFDTAPQYGTAEMLLGECKAKYGEKITIATKVGLSTEGVRSFALPFLQKQITKSQKALGVEQLDILQLNKPQLSDLADGSLFKFLSDLKKSGTIKMAGIVVEDMATGFQGIKSDVVDSMEIFYNLLFLEAEPLLEAAHKKGVGTIVRSPLNSGILSGCYKPDQKFSDNDDRSIFFHGTGFIDRLQRLKKIQNSLNISDAELLNFSIRFIVSNPYVTTVIPGVSKIKQAKNLVALGSDELFSEEQLNKIREVVSLNMAGYKQNPQL
jgi:aryl-alcohol dehydrogenase-like predicted oxidoreductase